MNSDNSNKVRAEGRNSTRSMMFDFSNDPKVVAEKKRQKLSAQISPVKRVTDFAPATVESLSYKANLDSIFGKKKADGQNGFEVQVLEQGPNGVELGIKKQRKQPQMPLSYADSAYSDETFAQSATKSM